jgi:hypothetical protein
MKLRPWKAFALVWAIDIAALVLIDVLFVHAGSAEWKSVGWARYWPDRQYGPDLGRASAS